MAAPTVPTKAPPTSAAPPLWDHALAERARMDAAHADEMRRATTPNHSPEVLLEQLMTRRDLAQMVAHAAQPKMRGDSGVIFPNAMVPDTVTYSMRFTIPALLRMGYHVEVYRRPVPEMILVFGGHAPKLHDVLQLRHQCVAKGHDHGHLVMYGNSPRQLRLKGVIKCVPRLLGWLRAARIALVDPKADALAEFAAPGVAAADLDAAGTTASERHEAEQTTRKRTLVDALHADADDVASGCCWAGVAKRRQPNATEAPPVFPMRIAAVRGDVFCFQNVYYSTEDPMATVQLLHRDEFDVAWQTMNVGETAIGTPWNGAGLEEEFEWRRTACYEDAVYPEDDEDEDEDE